MNWFGHEMSLFAIKLMNIYESIHPVGEQSYQIEVPGGRSLSIVSAKIMQTKNDIRFEIQYSYI